MEEKYSGKVDDREADMSRRLAIARADSISSNRASTSECTYTSTNYEIRSKARRRLESMSSVEASESSAASKNRVN